MYDYKCSYTILKGSLQHTFHTCIFLLHGGACQFNLRPGDYHLLHRKLFLSLLVQFGSWPWSHLWRVSFYLKLIFLTHFNIVNHQRLNFVIPNNQLEQTFRYIRTCCYKKLINSTSFEYLQIEEDKKWTVNVVVKTDICVRLCTQTSPANPFPYTMLERVQIKHSYRRLIGSRIIESAVFFILAGPIVPM